MQFEHLAYWMCVAISLLALVKLAKPSGRPLWITASALAYVSFFVALTRGNIVRDTPVKGGPSVDKFDGYVSSDTCLGCHPGEYHSWKSSFHRSMTTRPTRRTIAAPWEGASLRWQGRSYDILPRQDGYWVRLPDPARAARALRSGGSRADVPQVEREVLLVTGSHHYQAYWVRGERGNELYQFPFVYHLESKRFIPRHDAFLQPPDAKPHYARWNSNCIMCHSVAGQPRHDPSSDQFDSRVAEAGIACEACHGPGKRHVAHHRNPLARYREHGSSAPDRTIVNPARLDVQRRSEVCGQCHAYFVPKNSQEWWAGGFTSSYQPGETLEASRMILDYDKHKEHADSYISSSIDSIFYADGTIRVGGREYNGLIRSPCYERGRGDHKLTCLSCHQMHGDEPVDQLAEGMNSDRACASCHEKIAREGSAHTHHADESSGSRCMNCHMPYTTYALFKGIRSHRITSPSAERTRSTKTPSACNLCHLDKSLNWTARTLTAWYGQAPSTLDGKHEELSLAVLGLLKGDAATRVITAYAMGWEAAREASGVDWQGPVLAQLLVDPYSAVRFVAHRSLSTLPGARGLDYDFLAPEPDRARQKAELQSSAPPVDRKHRGSSLPYLENGKLNRALVSKLSSERDDRPISISE